jgi:hypothetical protein
MPSFQLTEYQHDNLVRAANSKSPLIMLPTKIDKDDAETVELLSTQAREMDELIALGFFDEHTSKHLTSITAAAVVAGRAFRMYHITELGLDMFFNQKFKTPALN